MVHQERRRLRGGGAEEWPVGQAVKTPASHAGNAGSIPARVTKRMDLGWKAGFRYMAKRLNAAKHLTGAYDNGVPPVPIPNTEVKPIRAEDTWRATAWENRSVPVQNMDDSRWGHPYIYSSIAQLAEHAAVNRRVVGSSPTWGANSKRGCIVRYFPFFFSYKCL